MLLLGIVLAIVSAAICMQIMGQFGTSPNTSLIGAVLVMVVARVPLSVAKKFRNLERQNYVISIASAAGFAAANCGFVAIAIVFILGRGDLIFPMAVGALIGSMISIFIMGRLFDSKIFPARGAWPMGQATASAIEAGDAGGKKGLELLTGLVVGAVASFFGIPAAGVGIAFIANMGSMAALGVGMILRGHSVRLFNGFDIGESNIAQGIMIGAGVIALVQIVFSMARGNKETVQASVGATDPGNPLQASVEATDPGNPLQSQLHKNGRPRRSPLRDINTNQSGNTDASQSDSTVSDSQAKATLAGSGVLFTAGAIIIAVISGIFGDMGLGQAILWIAYAGVSSVVIVILVGTAAMHSGWAPGFAVVTICLTLGLFLGFPPIPLAMLVGYVGSVGLPLTDTGIGLKAGWLIRGMGKDKAHEEHGRKQQVIIKQIGAVIGIAMAVTFGMMLAHGDVIPPMSIFYAQTVAETVNPALIRELALWAIPGAAVQAIFGNKSVGLMLATGLLINNPLFGIVLLAAIALRLIIGTKYMEIRGPGLIAGDGLFGFGANVWGMFF